MASDPSRTVFVVGATGTQGGPVARSAGGGIRRTRRQPIAGSAPGSSAAISGRMAPA
jgi:hypothetical protein